MVGYEFTMSISSSNHPCPLIDFKANVLVSGSMILHPPLFSARSEHRPVEALEEGPRIYYVPAGPQKIVLATLAFLLKGGYSYSNLRR